MKSFIFYLFAIFFLIHQFSSFGQNSELHHFSFQIENKLQLENITKQISIDNIKHDTVYAYANEKEWQQFLTWGYDYKEITNNNHNKVLNMASTVADMSNWDKYPTYEVYVQMMEKFATDYPQICKLEQIGTLTSGRKLLALKISDNVSNDNEAEPELLYTSTMHGDEATGFVLLLRLADYLLSNYNNAAYPAINSLINGAEIWLNPNANPDGTYKGGNSTISGAQRYNNSSIDLNRNFPVPNGSPNPDGNNYAEETEFMMDFAENHHFTMSANFHGGAEVLNYPWDTWSALAVDDNWWQWVSREYADLAQANSPAGYLTDLNNGITNGYAWYQTFGSRQDYMNFFHNCRELTIEISAIKLISSDQLDNHWTYNRDAFLAYLTQGLNGVRGSVSDELGNPLDAKITVVDHDSDTEQSWVMTDPRAGDYARYLKAGTYSIIFSSEGFVNKTINNVVVTDGQATILNEVLDSPGPELSLNFDQLNSQVVLDEIETNELILSNVGYADLNYNIAIQNAASHPWITLNSTNGIITAGNEQIIEINLNASGLAETEYNCNILISGDSTVTIPVTMNVYTRPLIELSKNSFNTTVLVVDELTDSLIIQNTGNADLNYTLAIKNASENPWITIDNNGEIVSPSSTSKTNLNFDAAVSGVGIFTTKLLIGGDIPMTIPIYFKVDTIPYFRPISQDLNFFKLIGESESKSIELENIGGDTIYYTTEIEYSNGNSWLSVNKSQGKIANSEVEDVEVSVNCNELLQGNYSASVVFKSTYDTVNIQVNLVVDTVPKLQISKTEIYLSAFTGNTIKDTITLSNLGGGIINLMANINYASDSNWIIPTINNYQLVAYGEFEFVYSIDARNLNPGIYSATLNFNEIYSDEVNITFEVIANPELAIDFFTINKEIDFGEMGTDTLYLENIGGGKLDYSANITFDDGSGWAQLNKQSGEIFSNVKDTIIISYNTANMGSGTFKGKFVIKTSQEKRIPLTLKVKSPPVLILSDTSLEFNITLNQSETKSVTLLNSGESILKYQVHVPTSLNDWLAYDALSGTLKQNETVALDATASLFDIEPDSKQESILIETNVGSYFINAELKVLVGLIDERLNKVLTYPNPFNEKISFVFNALDKNCKLKIYNIIGKQIIELSPSEISQAGVVFKWNGYAQKISKGIYLYQLISEGNELTGKIQKL